MKYCILLIVIIISVVSAQMPISCQYLLNSLLECGEQSDTTKEVVSIPYFCLDRLGTKMEDLEYCGFFEFEFLQPKVEEEDTPSPQPKVSLTTDSPSPSQKSFRNVFIRVLRQLILNKVAYVESDSPSSTPSSSPSPPVYGSGVSTAST